MEKTQTEIMKNCRKYRSLTIKCTKIHRYNHICIKSMCLSNSASSAAYKTTGFLFSPHNTRWAFHRTTNMQWIVADSKVEGRWEWPPPQLALATFSSSRFFQNKTSIVHCVHLRLMTTVLVRCLPPRSPFQNFWICQQSDRKLPPQLFAKNSPQYLKPLALTSLSSPPSDILSTRGVDRSKKARWTHMPRRNKQAF